MTLASASSTSSTDGMGTMLVAWARASAGARVHLRAGPARRAVRDRRGRRARPGCAFDDRAAGRRLARRSVADAVTGAPGLAPLQRDAAGRGDAPPRDRRRGARDLRRRVPDHTGLRDRHPRLHPADPADAGTRAARPAAHARAARGLHRDACGGRAHAPAAAPGRLRRRGHRHRARRPDLRLAPPDRRAGGQAAATVSEPALSLAFFDTAHRLSGTARAGATLIYEGQRVRTLSEPPELERVDDRFIARLGDELEVSLEPLGESAQLPGSESWLCAVEGTVAGARVECLGTATVTAEAPEWAELDALRAVSAVLDRENAVFLTSHRPRGAFGHGEERVSAVVITAGKAVAVEDARLSTVYDRDGRQRTAGLELWLPGEDYPHRASGSAQAGASIVLGGVRVDAAVFEWHMDGRTGAGAYELALRDGDEAAA